MDARRVELLKRKVETLVPASGITRKMTLSAISNILEKIEMLGIPEGATVEELSAALKQLTA